MHRTEIPLVTGWAGRCSARALAAAALVACAALPAQNVQVEEHVFENGLRLLILPRKGDPNVSAGWIARVGSVNERPGITGIAHLFEHMMFKGTRALGTRDIEKNLAVMKELDRVKEEIAKEERELRRRQLAGEVPDPARPEDRSERHRRLLAELEDLTKKERELIVKDEFDRIYTSAGASGMNAGTTNDFTIYFVNVPSNKIELWFWMESDRLLNPVFREFYSERDVVREERRLRIESTPTGRFEEEFDALFWTASPYEWPVIGWPSDLEAITREEALSFFDVHYAPNNLTACLVGDIEPSRAVELAKKYLGRLRRGPREPEPVRTREPPQLAERRMVAFAETKPQVTIRYHTVPDGHPDEPPLALLGDLLSGRTGRLFRALVLEKAAANEASAEQEGRKHEGYFEIQAVAKQEKEPEDVEKLIYEEIGKLRDELVPDRELQKVKNQRAASDFRQLRANFSLLLQLLVRDSGRGWRTINTDPPKFQAVTSEDIRRVARAYFLPEMRNVAIYHTKETEGAKAPPDPGLASLSEDDRKQVEALRASVDKADPAKVKELLDRLRSQEASAPAEKKDLISAMERILEERLKRSEAK